MLNQQNTKIMVVGKCRERKEDFILNGNNIEEVEKCVYTGSHINVKGSNTQESWRRMAMARRAMQHMVYIGKGRGMSLGLKVRFLCATAFSIAIYGCESWAMTSCDKMRVDAFELWCYRRLLRVSWVDKKTNKCVLDKIGSVIDVEKEWAWRRGRWGYVSQLCEKTLLKRLIQWQVEGKRRRGRPAMTGFQELKYWTKLPMVDASQMMADRERWHVLSSHSSADIVTWLEREGEREREREREGGDREREGERERERERGR